MTMDAEKYREAKKKYLAGLSPAEKEEIERRKREAEAESKKRWEELKEVLKPIHKLYENNLHHIKARDILIDAIQAAIDNPAMTPEVKETGESFILLLIETGDSLDFGFDAVVEPIAKIAKVQIPTMGGTARAEHDKKTDCLRKIEEEALSRPKQFKRYGYQKQFAEEMLSKYPDLKDDEAIKKRLRKLAKEGKIEAWGSK